MILTFTVFDMPAKELAPEIPCFGGLVVFELPRDTPDYGVRCPKQVWSGVTSLLVSSGQMVLDQVTP